MVDIELSENAVYNNICTVLVTAQQKAYSAVNTAMSAEYGKGFTVRNLQIMRQFFNTFLNMHALCTQLSWSHYRLLIRIDNISQREFYLAECAECNWSVRQLERGGKKQSAFSFQDLKKWYIIK